MADQNQEAYSVRTLYDGRTVLAPNKFSDADVNAYYGVQPPPPPPPQTNAITSFGHGAVRGALPAAGGFAGAAAGAEAGAALGLLGGPLAEFTVPIGAIGGGLAGAWGGSMVVNNAQDQILHAAPDLATALGQDDATRQADMSQQGLAYQLGEFAPNLVGMRPTLEGFKSVAKAGDSAAKAAIIGARVNMGIGAGIGGAQSVWDDVSQGRDIDLKQVALSTGLGLLMGKTTKFGEGLGRLSESAIPMTSGAREALHGRVNRYGAAPADTGALDDNTPSNLLSPKGPAGSQTDLDLTGGGMKPVDTYGPTSKDVPLHPDDKSRIEPLLGSDPAEALQQLRDARNAVEQVDPSVFPDGMGIYRKQNALARIDAVLTHPDVAAYAQHHDAVQDGQMDLLRNDQPSLFGNNSEPVQHAPAPPVAPAQQEMFNPQEAGAPPQPQQQDLFQPTPAPAEPQPPQLKPVPAPAPEMSPDAPQPRMALQPPTSASDILHTIRNGQPDPFTLKLASEMAAAVQSGDPVALQRAISTREQMLEHLTPHQRVVLENADAYARDAMQTNMDPRQPVTPDQQLRTQYALDQAQGQTRAPAARIEMPPAPAPREGATNGEVLRQRAAGEPNRVSTVPPEVPGQSEAIARSGNAETMAHLEAEHAARTQQAHVDAALADHHALTRAETLKRVLDDPATHNPEARFKNNLRRLGYRGEELQLTDRERVMIAKDLETRHPNRLPDTLAEEPDHQQVLPEPPKENTNGQGPDQSVAAPARDGSPEPQAAEKPAARKRAVAAEKPRAAEPEARPAAEPEARQTQEPEAEGEVGHTYESVRDDIVRAEQHGSISKGVSLGMRKRLLESEEASAAGKPTLTPEDMHSMLGEAQAAHAGGNAAPVEAKPAGPSAPGSKRWKPGGDVLGKRDITNGALPESTQRLLKPEATKQLRAELSRLGLHDVALRVETWTENLMRGGEDAGWAGSYDESKKLINVAMAADENLKLTLHHEAFHAMEDLGLIKPSEKEAVLRELIKDHDLLNHVQDRYSDVNDPIFENELLANGYEKWKAGQLAKEAAAGPVGRLFMKLSNALRSIGDMFRRNGYKTADELFSAVDRGVVGRREAGESTLGTADNAQLAKRTQNVVKYVLDGPTRNPDEQDLGKINWAQHPAKTGYELVTSMKTPVRTLLAEFTTMRQFADQHGKQLPEITHMIDNQNVRASMRDAFIHRATEITDKWADLPAVDHKALTDLLHDAEVEQTNVTKGDGPLQQRFSKMSKGAQEVYKSVIRHNRATADDAINIMTEHVQAMDLPQAQKDAMIAEHTAKLSREVYFPHMWFGDFITVAHSGEYAKALEAHTASAERVRELSKAPEDTEEVKAARQAATDAHNELHRVADKGGSAEELDQLRSTRDAARAKLADIAPPAEHPDLQAAKDEHEANSQKLADLSDDGHRMVIADESELAQERRIAGLKKEGYITETRKRQDFNEAPQGITTDYMEKLHEGFEQQRRANPEAKEAIDGMEQMARELMYAMRPTGSQLAAKLQRKGVAGFSRDSLRSFAAATKRDAGYLAALKHGPEMNQLMTDMKVKARSDNALDVVSKAITEHYNSLGKMAKSPVLDTLSNMTYAYMLGASPSFMVMHLMQTPMITLPWLHGKLGMKANVTGELMSAAKHFMETGGDSVWKEGMEHKGLNASEQDNIRYLISRNIIAATHTDNLINLSERTTPLSRAGNMVMKVAGMMPHYTEKYNRLVTAQAAYKLALAHPDMVERVSDADHAALLARTPELAHMTKEQLAASRFAEQAVADTHVDYSKENAPNAFNRGGAAKLMFQFMKYQQGMLHLLGDSAIKTLKGETPEVRAAAGRTLLGVLATHGVMTGAMGLPLLGTGLFLANMYHKLFGDQNEAFDAEDKMRQAMVKTFGSAGGEMMMRGALYNPVTKDAVPADITDRLGLGDMLSPGAKVGAITRQNAVAYMASVAGGPAGSLIAQFADAFDMHHKGEDWRAAEDLMPKTARDISKTIRFANYGVTTTSNNHVIDKGVLSPADLIVQSLGFEPQPVQEAYANREAVQGAKAELDDRRKVLIKRMTDARMENDAELMDHMREQIAAFNASRADDRLWRERINPSELSKAYMNRRLSDRYLSGGVSVTPKERALRDFMIDPDAQ